MKQKISEIFRNTTYALKHIFKINKIFLTLVILSSILTSIFTFVSTYMVKVIVQSVESKNKEFFLQNILLLLAITITVLLINSIILEYITPILQTKISYKIRKDIYQKNISNKLNKLLKASYYEDYYFVLQKSLDSFIGIISTLGQLFSNILSIIGISSIIIYYNASSLLIILIGVIISFSLSMKNESKRYNLRLKITEQSRKVEYTNRIFYQSEYAKEIRSSNSNMFFNLFKNANYNKISIFKNFGKSICTISFLSALVSSISILIVTLILGNETIVGKYPISSFAMLYTGVRQINGQLSSFFQTFPSLYAYSMNLDKYRAFMEDETDTETLQETQTITKLNKLEIKDMSFDYGNGYIFKDTNLTINNKQKKIAIIGANGSGKSTLISILLGLYKTTEGQVLINDIDLATINSATRNKLYSIVYQDFKIYSMSIIENITMQLEVTDDDIDKVLDLLKTVGLYDKIMKLEDKLDTVLSSEFQQNSVNFSLGELQKIAIARAYFQNSKIIILDEPYSFGDVNARKNMVNIIEKLAKDRTIILITHDLDSLETMDMILKIENKQINIIKET